MAKIKFVRVLWVAIAISMLPFEGLLAQTGLWEISDNVAMKYNSWRYCFSSAGDSDVALISETNSFPLLHVLRHSNDKGSTWNVVYGDSSMGTARWNTVVHRTAQQFIIAGDSEFYLGQDNFGNIEYRYRGFLHLSSDGGGTWTHHNFDSNTVVSDLAMYSENYGAALTHNVSNVYDSLPGTLPDSVFITSDGWKSLTAKAMPNGVQGCQQIFCFGVDTIGISGSPDSDNLCQYYKTTNGGNSWMLLGKFPYVVQIDFINQNFAWGAGTDFSKSPYQGLLIKTTDGGSSWITIMDTDLSEGFTGVSFADSIHGLVSGQIMLRTTDAGASWLTEYPPFGVFTPSIYVNKVFEPTPDLSFGVFGFNPVIRFAGKITLTAPFFHNVGLGPLPIAPTTISWTPIVGAKQYHLQLGTMSTSQGTYDPTMYNNPVLDTIVADTLLVLQSPNVATSYYGRVSAIGVLDNEQDTSDWRQSGDWDQHIALFYTVSKIGQPLPPEIISPPSGTHTSNTNVPLIISSIAGATSYSLQFLLEGQFPLIDTTVPDTSFTISGFNPGFFYLVEVKGNVPDDTSDWSNGDYILNVDAPSSVSEINDSTEFLIYPNPANGVLHIRQGDNFGQAQIRIYNALGEELTIPAIKNMDGLDLDVRAVPSGVYALQLLNEEPRVIRFIIAH